MEPAGDGDPFHIQYNLAGGCLLLFHGKAHGPAYHHLGKLFFGGILNVHGADAFSLAQHGTAIRHRHDLIELVGNE